MCSFTSLLSFIAATLALCATVSQADLTRSKRSHKPTVSAFPRDLLPRLDEADSLEEGVFHLPLVSLTANVSNTKGGLVRRASEDLPVEYDTLGIKVAIDGKPYTYQFLANDDGISATNFKDDPEAWNPATDKQASVSGHELSNPYHLTAVPYKVGEFSVGNTTLKNVGILYQQPLGDPPGGWTGRLGFGLPGSNAFPNSGSSFLKAIQEAKSWATPAFTVKFRPHTKIGSKIVLGAAQPAFWQASQPNRWAVEVDIGGHKGIADLSSGENWIVAPPDVAKDLMKQAGLTPSTNKDGDIIALFDCAKEVPDLFISLGAGRLKLQSKFGADDGKQCNFVVRGIEQDTYPTPFSLGMVAFINFDISFDFTPGAPRVGFAGLSV